MSGNDINLSESSSYQIYLDQIIDYRKALWNRHVALINNAVIREVVINGIGCRAGIEQLDWDTKVLNLPAGAITDIFHKQGLTSEEAETFVIGLQDEIDRSNLRFVKIRLSTSEKVLLESLMSKGWKITDSLNIYYSPLESLPNTSFKTNQQFSLSDFDLEESLAFFDKAPGLFGMARMYADRNVRKVIADKFYRELFNSQFSCPSSFKIGLWVDGKLVGLAIGNVDQWLKESFGLRFGYLWLIGLAEKYRGKSLSKPLFSAFLAEAGKHVDYLEIGTQVKNTAANKLYSSAGFELKTETVTLHWWKN